MNARSSWRVGTRRLAICSGARWRFLGFGLSLLLGSRLLGRLLARIVGRHRGGLLGLGGAWPLLAATPIGAILGRALGEQRDRLVDRQLLGLQIARHRGVDAVVL